MLARASATLPSVAARGTAATHTMHPAAPRFQAAAACASASGQLRTVALRSSSGTRSAVTVVAASGGKGGEAAREARPAPAQLAADQPLLLKLGLIAGCMAAVIGVLPAGSTELEGLHTAASAVAAVMVGAWMRGALADLTARVSTEEVEYICRTKQVSWPPFCLVGLPSCSS